MNFLHDFTLFVVDIHQIRLISLFTSPTTFTFMNHGSAGLIPKVNLSLRLMLSSPFVLFVNESL